MPRGVPRTDAGDPGSPLASDMPRPPPAELPAAGGVPGRRCSGDTGALLLPFATLPSAPELESPGGSAVALASAVGIGNEAAFADSAFADGIAASCDSRRGPPATPVPLSAAFPASSRVPSSADLSAAAACTADAHSR